MLMSSTPEICTEADYRVALERAKAILQAQPDEPEFDELNTLATLIEAYEALHYPMFP
jgi:HTH-type transcriptional regulator/antitoxin HigA